MGEKTAPRCHFVPLEADTTGSNSDYDYDNFGASCPNYLPRQSKYKHRLKTFTTALIVLEQINLELELGTVAVEIKR